MGPRDVGNPVRRSHHQQLGLIALTRPANTSIVAPHSGNRLPPRSLPRHGGLRYAPCETVANTRNNIRPMQAQGSGCDCVGQIEVSRHAPALPTKCINVGRAWQSFNSSQIKDVSGRTTAMQFCVRDRAGKRRARSLPTRQSLIKNRLGIAGPLMRPRFFQSPWARLHAPSVEGANFRASFFPRRLARVARRQGRTQLMFPA